MSHRWSSFGCRLWFKSLFIGILRIGWRFVRWILPSYPYICDAPISEQGELGFSLDNCEYMWLLIVSIYQRRFRSRVSWRSAISVSSISFFGIVRSLTFWHGTGMTTGASIYLRLLKVCSNYLPSSYIWCKVSLWIHDSVIILSYILSVLISPASPPVHIRRSKAKRHSRPYEVLSIGFVHMKLTRFSGILYCSFVVRDRHRYMHHILLDVLS